MSHIERQSNLKLSNALMTNRPTIFIQYLRLLSNGQIGAQDDVVSKRKEGTVKDICVFIFSFRLRKSKSSFTKSHL